MFYTGDDFSLVLLNSDPVTAENKALKLVKSKNEAKLSLSECVVREGRLVHFTNTVGIELLQGFGGSNERY